VIGHDWSDRGKNPNSADLGILQPIRVNERDALSMERGTTDTDGHGFLSTIIFLSSPPPTLLSVFPAIWLFKVFGYFD
jgi:hypothetical protein